MWIEAFGRDAVFCLAFEDYVADRHATARRVAGFVGLDPERLPQRPGVSNPRGSQRAARSALVAAAAGSRFYRETLRGTLPPGLRTAARCVLTRRRPVPEIRLSEATRAFLAAHVDHVGAGLEALGVTGFAWENAA